MTPDLGHYLWYGIASGPEIQQGDIIEACPVFEPQSTNLDDPTAGADFTWEERDVIVVTQSCDLVPGRTKTGHV